MAAFMEMMNFSIFILSLSLFFHCYGCHICPLSIAAVFQNDTEVAYFQNVLNASMQHAQQKFQRDILLRGSQILYDGNVMNLLKMMNDELKNKTAFASVVSPKFMLPKFGLALQVLKSMSNFYDIPLLGVSKNHMFYKKVTSQIMASSDVWMNNLTAFRCFSLKSWQLGKCFSSLKTCSVWWFCTRKARTIWICLTWFEGMIFLRWNEYFGE